MLYAHPAPDWFVSVAHTGEDSAPREAGGEDARDDPAGRRDGSSRSPARAEHGDGLDLDQQLRGGQGPHLDRVDAGKLPVKTSRRAFQTSSRRLMSVTKISTLTMSSIRPPAASIRCLIFPNMARACSYMLSPPTTRVPSRATMPAMKTEVGLPTTRQLDQVSGGGSGTCGLDTRLLIVLIAPPIRAAVISSRPLPGPYISGDRADVKHRATRRARRHRNVIREAMLTGAEDDLGARWGGGTDRGRTVGPRPRVRAGRARMAEPVGFLARAAAALADVDGAEGGESLELGHVAPGGGLVRERRASCAASCKSWRSLRGRSFDGQFFINPVEYVGIGVHFNF